MPWPRLRRARRPRARRFQYSIGDARPVSRVRRLAKPSFNTPLEMPPVISFRSLSTARLYAFNTPLEMLVAIVVILVPVVKYLTFNTPLEMRNTSRERRHRQRMVSFQYSIGDADLEERAGSLLGEALRFQYSIGDAGAETARRQRS